MRRKFLKRILRILATRVIRRYEPRVVGITGSVGKTTAKEAIYAVLQDKFHIRKNLENYNNELGIPLTVLGVTPLERSSFGKRIVFVLGIIKSLWIAYGFPRSSYPEILVLELGADRPGDISYLTEIVRPHVGVVTAIGEVPVHVEFYSSPAALAKEKSMLIKSLPVKDGLAVLNNDDSAVENMRNVYKGNTKTFGMTLDSDIWVSEVAYFLNENQSGIGGLSFKINQGDTFIPSRIYNMVAPHQLYGVLASVAVGLHFGLNLVDISTNFEKIPFPKGRMKLIQGNKKTVIIDDTYNSAPLSAHSALDVLRDFARATAGTGSRRPRKVAILGDMRELGKYSQHAHQVIGAYAAQVANFVIAIGDEAVFIAESAKDILGKNRVIHYHNVMEAVEDIEDLIKSNDLILVKGSQYVRLEKLVKKIMANPDEAKDTLIRQSERWQD